MGKLERSIYQSFGAKVKEYRLKKQLSQEELAYQAKIDTRSVVAIENGQRNPTMSTIFKICQVLGVQSDKILSF